MGLDLSINIETGILTGSVAIDSIVNDTSSGGMRIAEDISFEEIKALAAEMTLKYSFIGLPRGGAKSGIKMPAGLAGTERIRALEDFGGRLAPIIKAGIYFPGMDMNCGPEEMKAIYRGAGFTMGDVTDTSYFTAISVENAVYALEKYIKKDGPVTVAIEGFGSVASYLAQRLPPERFRIVALSTINGAVEDKSGFDVKGLIEARKGYRDGLVEKLGQGKRVEKEDVLRADVDLLIPSARTWVINRSNVREVKARFIVPVANAPYTEETIDVLHEASVVCLPGFVTNSGGVYASSLFDSGVAVESIEKISARYYRAVVDGLLEKSFALKESPVRVAEKIARARLAARLNGGGGELSGRLLKKMYRKRMVPKSYYSKVVLNNFVDNLKALDGEIKAY